MQMEIYKVFKNIIKIMSYDMIIIFLFLFYPLSCIFCQQFKENFSLELKLPKTILLKGEYVYGEIIIKNNIQSKIIIPLPNRLIGGLRILITDVKKIPLQYRGINFEGSEDSLIINPGETFIEQIELSNLYGNDSNTYPPQREFKKGDYDIIASLGNIKS